MWFRGAKVKSVANKLLLSGYTFRRQIKTQILPSFAQLWKKHGKIADPGNDGLERETSTLAEKR